MFADSIRKATSVGVLLLVLLASAASAQEKLSSYPIDPAKVSISGISSGAFMANQFHIAHSKLIMGAGIVAGGLYGCAVQSVDGNGEPSSLISIAVGPCMTAPGLLGSAGIYAGRARNFATRGTIDPLSGLEGDRVYIFTGRSDKVVNSRTVERGRDVYLALGVAKDDVKFVGVNDLPGNGAGHSWVTKAFGVPCSANESPYINKCNYDQAGAILKHIYGDLKDPAAKASGSFVKFPQAEFVPGGMVPEKGMWNVGVVYVPQTCEPGGTKRCALHVALHGCLQSAQKLDDKFYRNVGLNEWADTNDIIVLYPQARSFGAKDVSTQSVDTLFQTNPEGCWNWFGYGSDRDYMLKSGVQITALHAMIQRMMGAEK
jgi:poly(3-hydroxybutyrate) depolymerase